MGIVVLVLLWHLVQWLMRLYAYFHLKNTYRGARHDDDNLANGA